MLILVTRYDPTGGCYDVSDRQVGEGGGRDLDFKNFARAEFVLPLRHHAPFLFFQFNLRCSGRDLAKPSAGRGREVLPFIPRSPRAERLYQRSVATSQPSGSPRGGAGVEKLESTC